MLHLKWNFSQLAAVQPRVADLSTTAMLYWHKQREEILDIQEPLSKSNSAHSRALRICQQGSSHC